MATVAAAVVVATVVVRATQSHRYPKYVLLYPPNPLSVLLGSPSTGHRPHRARRLLRRVR